MTNVYVNPDPPDEIRRQVRKRLRSGVYSPRTCLEMYRDALRYWYEAMDKRENR